MYCLKKTFSYIAFSKSLSLKKSFWYFEKSIFGTLTYLKLKAIQDSGTFTTGGIFRTLSNLYDKMFCKKATWHSFKDQVWKIKKVPFKKDSFIFLYFGKFLTLIIRNFLYFLQKKKKIFFYFRKKNEQIPFISGNGTFLYFKKLLIFQEVTFKAQKLRKNILKMFPIFWEVELSCHMLKELLIFQEDTYKAWQLKKITFFVCWKRIFQT